MKKKRLIILAAVLLVLSITYSIIAGQSGTVSFNLRDPILPADQYHIVTDHGNDLIEITERTVNDNKLILKLRSASRGEECLLLQEQESIIIVYIHPTGVIAENTYFGYSNGCVVFPIAITIFLAYLCFNIKREYDSDMDRSLYQYENILDLAFLIFFVYFLLIHALSIYNYQGLASTAMKVLGSASTFSFLALPVAFVISIYVSISNIILMKKEGRSRRNMLGFFMGLLCCFLTLLPEIISNYLQSSGQFIGVHDSGSVWPYLEMFLESTISLFATYLECVLAATIIIGFRAARNVPPYDMDYVLILGCQIRDDGSLTPLLRSRADRALNFAKAQKEATGKDVTFVPSGGQGDDEIMPEARAIANYLLSQGIPEERILVEDRSVNTQENMTNSLEIIRKHSNSEDVKIAFATTNYHVFRAGLIANSLGIHAEGIGGATKSYFWINAFLREFIAIIYTRRKVHIKILLILIAVTALMATIVGISNIL